MERDSLPLEYKGKSLEELDFHHDLEMRKKIKKAIFKIRILIFQILKVCKKLKKVKRWLQKITFWLKQVNNLKRTVTISTMQIKNYSKHQKTKQGNIPNEIHMRFICALFMCVNTFQIIFNMAYIHLDKKVNSNIIKSKIQHLIKIKYLYHM